MENKVISIEKYIVPNSKALCEGLGSIFFKSFITSLESGESYKVARARAILARDLENDECEKIGSPRLACGYIEKEGDNIIYYSGSGTKYIIEKGPLTYKVFKHRTKDSTSIYMPSSWDLAFLTITNKE